MTLRGDVMDVIAEQGARRGKTPQEQTGIVIGEALIALGSLSLMIRAARRDRPGAAVVWGTLMIVARVGQEFARDREEAAVRRLEGRS